MVLMQQSWRLMLRNVRLIDGRRVRQVPLLLRSLLRQNVTLERRASA